MMQSETPKLDPELVAELKEDAQADNRDKWRVALRRFPLQFAVAYVLLVIVPALWRQDLMSAFDYSTGRDLYRHLLNPLVLATIWVGTDVAVRWERARKADRLAPMIEEEMSKAHPQRWIPIGLRTGMLFGLAVGLLVGTFIVFVGSQDKQLADTPLETIGMMVAVTWAWAIPLCLVKAWIENKMTLSLRSRLEHEQSA